MTALKVYIFPDEQDAKDMVKKAPSNFKPAFGTPMLVDDVNVQFHNQQNYNCENSNSYTNTCSQSWLLILKG